MSPEERSTHPSDRVRELIKKLGVTRRTNKHERGVMRYDSSGSDGSLFNAIRKRIPCEKKKTVDLLDSVFLLSRAAVPKRPYSACRSGS